MTREQIHTELKEISKDWENYLANTPTEIKHRLGDDGKTDILRRYSLMIKRKQELYQMHYESCRHIIYYDIKPWPKNNGV